MSTSKYRATHKMEARVWHAANYARNRKEKKAYMAAYRIANEKMLKAKSRAWTAAHPERTTVHTHYQLIFNPNSRQHRNYKGMPFYEKWNPKRGGSYDAAEKWIIENLGRRPKGTSLHIVDPILGFVPGNMEWTHRRKQNREQLVKIIARQKHRIKELEKSLALYSCKVS